MNADSAAQRRLLDLAEVDAELARAAHRRRSLPELAEIEQAEQELRSGRDSLVASETVASDLDREIRKLEAEIDQVRAREDRDRGLMDSGSISSGKQLEDLQHELATLQRRQGVLEDELLEVMEQREATDADLARHRAALAEIEQRLADAARRRDEVLADLETTEARRAAERTAMLGELPEDLLALYERLRAQKGIGAAALRQRRCGACRLELDRTAIGRIRDAAPDAVLRCEECGVVLVRVAESGLPGPAHSGESNQ
ncbi:MAG TPA: C4-type zinc ribbon domain-containing protein [Pseudonocardiaceae bacterium]|nr:C4-type zinc ribbon domain-containing protein [Pseudonocardiaceae bacterium]